MWLLAIYHRLCGIWLDRRGDVRHTHYPGDSVFARWLPFSDAVCKVLVETLFWLVVGLAGAILSPSLTLFIWGAAVAGAIKGSLIEFYQMNEFSDLHDMRIEQEQRAERFRNGR